MLTFWLGFATPIVLMVVCVLISIGHERIKTARRAANFAAMEQRQRDEAVKREHHEFHGI